MSLMEKLFGKKKNADPAPAAQAPERTKTPEGTPGPAPGTDAAQVLAAQQKTFAEKAAEQEREGRISDQELLQIFREWFAPNTDFYSVPGSPKFEAYFRVVRAARDELARAPQFLERTAGRSEAEYRQMLTQQVPGLTNMLICGLIFCAGRFAVVRDMLYCVNFSERIPNCIALYLLLIAQKQPADKRSQGLDLGDGTDPAPLKAAIETLQVCDPSWQPKILWP